MSVAGLVDNAHAALAELLDYFVVQQPLADIRLIGAEAIDS
jgi:hypothetical protein